MEKTSLSASVIAVLIAAAAFLAPLAGCSKDEIAQADDVIKAAEPLVEDALADHLLKHHK